MAGPDETGTGVFWLDLEDLWPLAAKTKRLIDIALALVLIILVIPLFLLTALLVKVSSSGPVFFRQERIGYRGNRFLMYKFRTMLEGAETVQRQLADLEGSDYLKVTNDPRVTRFGGVMRKFSLDELPQLFNVLEGTMSLVGPRPLLLSDLSKFSRRSQMRRFAMKPGITGLWQVSGRSNCTDQERMELDRRYVNEWSLALDLKILLKTVAVVLLGRDAR